MDSLDELEYWYCNEVAKAQTEATRRIREQLEPYVDPSDLDDAVKAVMKVVIPFAGHFHHISDRRRVREKRLRQKEQG